MGSAYRTWSMAASLIGLNIASFLFKFNLEGNFLLGNHLADSIMVLAFVSLLSDLNLLPRKYQDNLLAIGVIALVFGAFWEVLSFGSVAIISNTTIILKEWFAVAPIMILFVGLPVLMIANQVSREMKIFGKNSTGKNGLIFVSLFSLAYTVAAIYGLIKFGLLVI